ncbi:hypothetical protein GS461_10380, partial [Rhodococcus hoagii]|nr:hypothetical protein [Prescottella equi]
LKYTEAQTVATTRVVNLGGPRWLAAKVWAKLLPPFIKAMKYVQGQLTSPPIGRARPAWSRPIVR